MVSPATNVVPAAAFLPAEAECVAAEPPQPPSGTYVGTLPEPPRERNEPTEPAERAPAPLARLEALPCVDVKSANDWPPWLACPLPNVRPPVDELRREATFALD